MRVRPLLSSSVALTMLATGCTMVGTRPTPAPAPPAAEAPPSPPAPRQFGGRAQLGGQAMEVVLELTALGGDGREEAVLRLPDLGLEASGTGRWSGRTLELELRYGQECAGTVELRLAFDEKGDQATGSMVASDCTGSDTGPLTLHRRGTPPPRPPAPRPH